MDIYHQYELIYSKGNNIYNRDDDNNTLYRECGEVDNTKEWNLCDICINKQQVVYDKDQTLMALQKRLEELQKELNGTKENKNNQSEIRITFNLIKAKHLILTWSSPTRPLRSHSLVCMENHLFILGIVPLRDKEL